MSIYNTKTEEKIQLEELLYMWNVLWFQQTVKCEKEHLDNTLAYTVKNI